MEVKMKKYSTMTNVGKDQRAPNSAKLNKKIVNSDIGKLVKYGSDGD